MADTGRVRLHLQPASGSGAALCEKLRAIARRITRPSGQTQPRKRTQNWIKLGGNVTTLPGRVAHAACRNIVDAIDNNFSQLTADILQFPRNDVTSPHLVYG
jgi:hypothetical protein